MIEQMVNNPDLDLFPEISFEEAREGAFSLQSKIDQSSPGAKREDLRLEQGYFLFQLLLNRSIGQAADMFVGIKNYKNYPLHRFSQNKVFFDFQNPETGEIRGIFGYIDNIGSSTPGGVFEVEKLIGEGDMEVIESPRDAMLRRYHEHNRINISAHQIGITKEYREIIFQDRDAFQADMLLFVAENKRYLSFVSVEEVGASKKFVVIKYSLGDKKIFSIIPKNLLEKAKDQYGLNIPIANDALEASPVVESLVRSLSYYEQSESLRRDVKL